MHGIDEGELEIDPSDTTPVLYSTEGRLATRSSRMILFWGNNYNFSHR